CSDPSCLWSVSSERCRRRRRWAPFRETRTGGSSRVPEPPVRRERATGIEPATSSFGISLRPSHKTSLLIRTHPLRLRPPTPGSHVLSFLLTPFGQHLGHSR